MDTERIMIIMMHKCNRFYPNIYQLINAMSALDASRCSASSRGALVNDAWKAFNGSLTTAGADCWLSAAGKTSGEYIWYKFDRPTCIKELVLWNRGYSTVYPIKNFKFQGSNDGANYEDIATLINNRTSQGADVYYNERGMTEYSFNQIKNDKFYLYYRILVIDAYSTRVAIGKIEMYGYNIDEWGKEA